MSDCIQIDEQVAVGSLPTVDNLKQLKQEGFASVVNLHANEDESRPFSPREEGIRVRELGMQYLCLSVSSDGPSAHEVDDFCTKSRLILKPAFVHGAEATKAGAFVMMERAVQHGWNGEQTLQKSRELGLDYVSRRLEKFIVDYVDSRTQ